MHADIEHQFMLSCLILTCLAVVGVHSTSEEDASVTKSDVRELLNSEVKENLQRLQHQLDAMRDDMKKQQEMVQRQLDMVLNKLVSSSSLAISTKSLENTPVPRDCADVMSRGEKTSGVYTVYVGTMKRPVQVYCDMTTDGGGWTEGVYRPYVLRHLPTFARNDHSCSTTRCQKLTVINDEGMVVNVLCNVCDCEAPSVTLCRYGLWSCTPCSPRCAFSMQFLRLAEALMITCHVSLHGFTEAIRYKNGMSQAEFSWVYRMLVNETFEEFRHHCFLMRTLCNICPSLSDVDFKCPACPQTAEQKFPLVVSFDGNFGLVHKRSAGRSFELPKHGDRIFVPDDTVKSFTEQHSSTGKADDTECSNFKPVVLSTKQVQKLDVTGVFGATCKHEVPVKMMNMEHGERFAYATLLMQQLLEEHGQSKHNYVIYDVACALERHLQKSQEMLLLGNYQFAVPLFHVYGHEAACQVNYSTRRVSGIGRVDGESLERLWSYLRHFGSMTKEMTPSHRIDLLTDACLYYGSRKISDIDDTLIRRHLAACKERETVEEELRKLMVESGVQITDVIVQQWLSEERENLQKQKCSVRKLNKSWEEKYVGDLLQLESLQCYVSRSNDNDLESPARIVELQRIISATEKKQLIAMRWNKTDLLFQQHWQRLEQARRFEQLTALLQLARERTFLMEVKKRHAVGQKLAVRVGQQIKRCTTKMKRAVLVYNDASLKYNSSDRTQTLPHTLAEKDVFDISSSLYQSLQLCAVKSDAQTDAVPYWLRNKAAELKLRMQRADEERDITLREMQQVSSYYALLHTTLTNLLRVDRDDDTDDTKKLSAGQQCMLLQKLMHTERRCHELSRKFSPFTDVTDINNYFVCDEMLHTQESAEAIFCTDAIVDAVDDNIISDTGSDADYDDDDDYDDINI